MRTWILYAVTFYRHVVLGVVVVGFPVPQFTVYANQLRGRTTFARRGGAGTVYSRVRFLQHDDPVRFVWRGWV